MKEIIDTIILILFVMFMIFLVTGFTQGQAEKFEKRLEEGENDKSNNR